ncbi:hypothetical protein PIIN_10053 [Serendipita indica DSM 11827]|uniref:Uncharacterized protein n=1 Tax=Serendipita indica (strain DSM 11827) TaxID=1109443 RepID=G4TXL0_SERID|nr:hypothetical protein PIIN_10053 [Serendipita indica DSM 11827]
MPEKTSRMFRSALPSRLRCQPIELQHRSLATASRKATISLPRIPTGGWSAYRGARLANGCREAHGGYDTRSTWDEEMPRWMVLYGITYSSEIQGFTIHAYHPIFESPEDPRAPHGNASWGAVSTDVTTDFKGIWRRAP